MNEKYIEGLYKKKTESPYAVTIGNDLNQYGELLASAYIVSIYNGSLTHILLFYEKIRDFLFYLSCKYDDWNLRRDLLKLAIYAGKEKEVKQIQNYYPEVLNNLVEKDAAIIMEFCNNHPLKFRRFVSQLLAFGAVGYYLDDEYFNKYESIIMGNIKEWLEGENSVVAIGSSIFYGLDGVAYRMSQDTLAEICCIFVDNHYKRWYMDMFKFIERRIDLNKMSKTIANELIEHIIMVLENDKEREEIRYAPRFLFVLRKQSYSLTEELDKKVAEYLPDYYAGDYKLETTKNEQQDLPKFIQDYVKCIKHNNETQGLNGMFFGHGMREIATVRAILLGKELACDTTVMDSIIAAVVDTLLASKEGISTKLDAISLLSCIAVKYPDDYKRNLDLYERLIEKRAEIEAVESSVISSNIDGISLKIGLSFLFTAMGIDTYSDILELMPYIQNDVATTISVANLIDEYLEVTNEVVFPKRIETVILQNVMQWLHSDYLDIRWIATKILFAMLRNPENKGIVNHQLLNLVDSDCFYIKNLIMRQIYKVDGITEATRDYIISKCENDPHFVVRLVCEEEKNRVER